MKNIIAEMNTRSGIHYVYGSNDFEHIKNGWCSGDDWEEQKNEGF